MLLGIDVGGTYTDGVLFDGQKVLNTFKYSTDQSHLKETVLKVLDTLLLNQKTDELNRIVLSTTVVTNLLATHQGEQPALILLPGPGLPFETYHLFPHTYFLQGAIDFRGREIEKMVPSEVSEVIADLEMNGIRKVGVAGKFSNRNPAHEKAVQNELRRHFPDMEIAIGSDCAGQLNFMRRLVTTYYSIMTRKDWQGFISEIKKAVQERELYAAIDILKADGGTMPLEISAQKPCETIFSGPAASTMGAVALRKKKANAVVLDIGGTTSDISLLIEGNPLYASKGATIDGHFTHVNAFAVRSVALGGDSPVWLQNGQVNISPRRIGPAACFGGKSPCVTDVFNYLYQLKIGDEKRSEDALQEIAMQAGLDIMDLCHHLEGLVIESLHEAIQEMFDKWENEPAYKVWEVVNGRKFEVDEIIGIGAAAHAIVPILARKMNVESFVHPYAPVANAIGACVARPTLSLTVHADTQTGHLSVDQEGISQELKNPRKLQLKDVRALAEKYLQDLAEKRGMGSYASEAEFFLEEQFNMIRGWDTVGKIFEVGIQIAPGLIQGFEGVEI